MSVWVEHTTPTLIRWYSDRRKGFRSAFGERMLNSKRSTRRERFSAARSEGSVVAGKVVRVISLELFGDDGEGRSVLGRVVWDLPLGNLFAAIARGAEEGRLREVGHSLVHR